MFRPRKRWQQILLILLLLLGLFAAWVFYPAGVWPFVPRFPELLDLGEQYEVTILRDTYGVPHIYGRTDADAAFGLAYAHAEDDFLTIQQAMIAARGKLGQAYGIDAAPNDFMVQLLRIWEIVDAEYDTIPADTQAIMAAYADGLNLYAARHPEEVLIPALYPLTGKDVVAGFIHRVPLFFGIDGALGELFAEERQRAVSGKTAVLPTLIPDTVLHLPDPVRFGSNAIAVSPVRTANGETFLAVNSHQPWEGIVAWYEAHMVSEEGWNMVGGLLPGSPTITHGHNEHLGWAFTVNSPDLIDIFVLEINPDNPDQYWFDGQWRDLEVAQAPITVNLIGRLNWTVRREILYSVYGPTVRQAHGTYAIRFAGMGEVGHVEQFYRMNKATSFDEWQAAMREGPLPMFNTVYADEAGNIFYVYNGRIPLRAEGYDWSQYLPGDTAETLWTDYLPYDQLPQVLNPSTGFVQNANDSPFAATLPPDNPDPTDFSETLGIDDVASNRSLRALTLYGGDDTITADEFIAYKYDMGYAPESDVAQMVSRLVAMPSPDDPDEQLAQKLLAEWDLQTTPDSLGATVAIVTLNFLYQAEGADISISNMSNGRFSDDLLQTSFAQAVDLLVKQHGSVELPWGTVNRLIRGDTDLPVGGAPDVLHAVYGELMEDGRFRGIAGDSYILMVQWDANGTVTSESIHQFGSATLDESSPHYADQAPIFVARQLKEVWFTETAVRANLSSEYAPGEEP